LGSRDGGGQRRLGGNILKMVDVSLMFRSGKGDNGDDGGDDNDDSDDSDIDTSEDDVDTDGGGGNVMLDKFSYDFNKGDKIGIVGANGVGKSTFIKVLTGQQPVDSGDVKTGETVVFGIYDQTGLVVEDETQRVLEFVKERVEARDGSSMAEAPQEAMKLLKQFQFERNRWNDRVAMLSGGERRRLQLLSVLTKRPNFLVLDEPTNDIDLDTLAALEAYLDEFNGVVVIVSHDRFFTDKVAKHLFVFEGNGVVKDYAGSLSDYAECLIEQERTANTSSDRVSSTSGGTAVADVAVAVESNGTELSFAERKKRNNAVKKRNREMENIEKETEKLKLDIGVIEKEFENVSSDEGWSRLAELTEQMNKIKEEVDEKEMRWMELAELNEIEQED